MPDADDLRKRIDELEAEVSRSDLIETQLHAALEREQVARAWMRRARSGLESLVAVDGLLVAAGARPMAYMDDIRRLIERCPLPKEDADDG